MKKILLISLLLLGTSAFALKNNSQCNINVSMMEIHMSKADLELERKKTTHWANSVVDYSELSIAYCKGRVSKDIIKRLKVVRQKYIKYMTSK